MAKMTREEIREKVREITTEYLHGIVKDMEDRPRKDLTDAERDEAAIAHDSFKDMIDHVGRFK